jgi:hypothetical protein
MMDRKQFFVSVPRIGFEDPAGWGKALEWK